ncbi:hypothetical protein AGLY_008439 [Aphis glycines]|uniref:Uncharacterized protein n=1 Tax=Aphis glycines TaxID=307491 RepID=A0A6G0TM92_APHGL|nr:hypothetical protein AGLY_008439 [Aphis glycines]
MNLCKLRIKALAGNELCLGFILLINTRIQPLKSALTKTYPSWLLFSSDFICLNTTSGLGAKIAHPLYLQDRFKSLRSYNLMRLSFEVTNTLSSPGIGSIPLILRPVEFRPLVERTCIWSALQLHSKLLLFCQEYSKDEVFHPMIHSKNIDHHFYPLMTTGRSNFLTKLYPANQNDVLCKYKMALT